MMYILTRLLPVVMEIPEAWYFHNDVWNKFQFQRQGGRVNHVADIRMAIKEANPNIFEDYDSGQLILRVAKTDYANMEDDPAPEKMKNTATRMSGRESTFQNSHRS